MENMNQDAVREEVIGLLNFCDSRKEQALELLGYLESLDFYSAPASSVHHNNHSGGLIEHSIGVTKTLLRVKMAMLDASMDVMQYATKEQTDSFCKISNESCVLVGLFHDIHKIEDGFGKKFYVPNLVKSGKVSEAKPYEVNKELMAFAGSFKSALIVSRFIDLYEHEMQAIAYHDGQYIPSGREVAMKEHPLTLMVHFADMWSAALIEDKNSWLYRPITESKFCK